MLELGLARIGRLIVDSPSSWRAIHVAGTNGKGSVCAYVSSMLHASGVPCGRFTSPHLIDRWDCITLNEQTVEEGLFRQIEDRIMTKNEKEDIKATEFELLTATAFEIFAQEKIKIAVVEVGLGGRFDATNVIRNPLLTVITKIGRDHESYLGNTLEAIAYQKGGIMKPNVPCIIDGTNPSSVLEVLDICATESQAGSITRVPQDYGGGQDSLWDILPRDHFESHQRMNIDLAFQCSKLALEQIKAPISTSTLIEAIRSTVWPGRLQETSIYLLTDRRKEILLDGAHNTQSALALGSFVDRKLRLDTRPVTWVLAASKGKNLNEMLPLLLRPGDNLVTVEFGPVAGMPWVEATPAEDLLQIAQDICQLDTRSCSTMTVLEGLRWATNVSEGGPLVIAGSLYLVSDTLRLLRDAGNP